MIDWIAAGIAVVKVTAAIATWLERQAADKEKFNRAIALELEAQARARAKVAKIAEWVQRISDEELAARIAATRRPPKGV